MLEISALSKRVRSICSRYEPYLLISNPALGGHYDRSRGWANGSGLGSTPSPGLWIPLLHVVVALIKRQVRLLRHRFDHRLGRPSKVLVGVDRPHRVELDRSVGSVDHPPGRLAQRLQRCQGQSPVSITVGIERHAVSRRDRPRHGVEHRFLLGRSRGRHYRLPFIRSLRIWCSVACRAYNNQKPSDFVIADTFSIIFVSFESADSGGL